MSRKTSQWGEVTKYYYLLHVVKSYLPFSPLWNFLFAVNNATCWFWIIRMRKTPCKSNKVNRYRSYLSLGSFFGVDAIPVNSFKKYTYIRKAIWYLIKKIRRKKIFKQNILLVIYFINLPQTCNLQKLHRRKPRSVSLLLPTVGFQRWEEIWHNHSLWKFWNNIVMVAKWRKKLSKLFALINTKDLSKCNVIQKSWRY